MRVALTDLSRERAVLQEDVISLQCKLDKIQSEHADLAKEKDETEQELKAITQKWNEVLSLHSKAETLNQDLQKQLDEINAEFIVSGRDIKCMLQLMMTSFIL